MQTILRNIQIYIYGLFHQNKTSKKLLHILITLVKLSFRLLLQTKHNIAHTRAARGDPQDRIRPGGLSQDLAVATVPSRNLTTKESWITEFVSSCIIPRR